MRNNALRNFARRVFKNWIPWTAFFTFLILCNAGIPYLLFVSLGLLFIGLVSYGLGRYLKKDTPSPEPAPRLTQLLTRVTELPTPEKNLLSEQELNRFKEIADASDLEKLQAYEKFINDTCGITLTNIPELEFPVTVEHARENPVFAKTYEKEGLESWITHQTTQNQNVGQNINICEPQKRWYQLDDQHIKIYSGFPQWVVNFVKDVLNKLEKNPVPKRIQIAEERDQYYQKNYKALFSPRTQNTPENKTHLFKDSKMYVA